jgi:hypothetical protein
MATIIVLAIARRKAILGTDTPLLSGHGLVRKGLRSRDHLVGCLVAIKPFLTRPWHFPGKETQHFDRTVEQAKNGSMSLS